MKQRKKALSRTEAALAHDPIPEHLNAAERALLREALDRGEALRHDVESAVTVLGQWILERIFAGDPAAALEGRAHNVVWRELLRRAGGPTLKVSKHLLQVAVQLAAHDRRILDQAWQGLDAGRKELLLPLATDARLRAGAHQVTKFNLSHKRTREYVAAILAEDGKERRVRLTIPRLADRLRRLHESLSGDAVAKKLASFASAPAEERDRALEEVEALREKLKEIAQTLRRRGGR